MEQERLHPEATGELSNLLYDDSLAAKNISRNVRRAMILNAEFYRGPNMGSTSSYPNDPVVDRCLQVS